MGEIDDCRAQLAAAQEKAARHEEERDRARHLRDEAYKCGEELETQLAAAQAHAEKQGAEIERLKGFLTEAGLTQLGEEVLNSRDEIAALKRRLEGATESAALWQELEAKRAQERDGLKRRLEMAWKALGEIDHEVRDNNLSLDDGELSFSLAHADDLTEAHRICDRVADLIDAALAAEPPAGQEGEDG